MDHYDYPKMFQRQNGALSMLPFPIVDNVYSEGDGLYFRSDSGGTPAIFDAVKLSANAFLLASDYAIDAPYTHRQIINDGDWIHFQFRVNGGGREDVAGGLIETPGQSCIVTRYPNHSVVSRLAEASERARVACLFVKSSDLRELMRIDPGRVPMGVDWIFDDRDRHLSFMQKPLRPAMAMAVSDILSCRLSGLARRTYMLAKSLELLSEMIDLFETDAPRRQAITAISSQEARKLERAREIMLEEIDATLTLGQLARRVGLNRTKLSEGFREMYGVPVWAFWRDAKLSLARQMLLESHLVTDVALHLGYSEISSFSRAFMQKYGVRPGDVKLSALNGECARPMVSQIPREPIC